MVHRLPDSTGLVETEFNTKRTGVLISNFDLRGGVTSNNLVITPKGGGGITITLPPGCKIRIPDKIGLKIQGDNGSRNFIVLEWEAGSAE